MRGGSWSRRTCAMDDRSASWRDHVGRTAHRTRCVVRCRPRRAHRHRGRPALAVTGAGSDARLPAAVGLMCQRCADVSTMSRDIVSDVATHHTAEGVVSEPTEALRLQRFSSAKSMVPIRPNPFIHWASRSIEFQLVPFDSPYLSSNCRQGAAHGDATQHARNTAASSDAADTRHLTHLARHGRRRQAHGPRDGALRDQKLPITCRIAPPTISAKARESPSHRRPTHFARPM